VANDLGITLEMVTASYEAVIPSNKNSWVRNKIDEAVRELISVIPDVVTRVNLGTLDRDLVTDKVVAAVLRVVRNPTGFDQESEGEYSYKLRPTVASGDIWYPTKDLVQLGWVNPDKANRPRTVFSTPSRGFGFPS
jgi:hypothetical protein